MKRTKIEAKPYHSVKTHTKLKRVGRKGKLNARANRLLKQECERLGINRCEAQFEGCWQTEALSFAHVAKRRELLAGELEACAIVACIPCHTTLDEKMSHAEMRAFIEQRLAERADRYVERYF